jgi:hypothetical protein
VGGQKSRRFESIVHVASDVRDWGSDERVG